MVNNDKIPIASDDEVKQFYKICLGIDLEPDEWIKDSRCFKHMTGNQKFFSTYKAYNGGNVIFGSNLRGNIIGKGQICDNKCKVIFSEHDSEINKDGKVIVSVRTDHGREFDNKVQFGEFRNANGITHNFSAPRTPQSNGMVERKNWTLQEMSRMMVILGKTPYELLRGRKPTLDYFKVFGSYSRNSKAYIILNKHTMKIEESLNVKFDETPPPSKTSPLVDDVLDEEEPIKGTEKKNLENDIEDETLEVD
ncbi:retrovirus-related pol polyprotein from transposon TNT 1-94 [Tanacetum coccineum]|uniref:Retrovirus-related pol polyprotein from transposon TNT 1-94 n=1 Tax=Tanacetum coccineum TaxID=301880 RepID=A0ABQ4ZW77_9ASTR